MAKFDYSLMGTVNKNGSAGGLELLDQALHHLRREGSGLGTYYLGTGPFFLALLYYWVDMSQGADAWRTHELEALGLTLLFFWMTAWQSYFASTLLRRMDGLQPIAFSWRRWWRRCRNQGIYQGLALLVLPMAGFLTIPFPWVYAYVHHFAALDDGEIGLRELSAQAKEGSQRWVGLNSRALLALSAAGLILFINLFAAGMIIPMLLKLIFGVETVFSRTPWAYFNSTSFVLCAMAVYLFLDPLVRAFYVLLCHDGAVLKTGLDLEKSLRQAADERFS